MISAIIVNHNGRGHLQRCLESLACSGQALEVLVVDNASTDGSLDLLREDFPQVTLLEQDRNLGFGAANNLAAAAAGGEALLLINADAWLEEGALEHLAARLASHDRNGLAAPRLLYPDGRRQFAWSPERGAMGEALQLLRNRFESSAWAHGPLARVLSRLAGRRWYTAACVLVRTDAFREVGGFDERFFMYFEDVDLCRRVRAAGWQVLYWPAGRMVHLLGRSSGVTVEDGRRRRAPRYFYEARARYFAKHHGRLGLLAANLLWWLGRGVSLTRQVFGRDPELRRREGLDIWIHFTRPLAPYRELRA